MRKLYLVSNYITALYELDESNLCIAKDDRISIDSAIELFRQNQSVKSFGILRAYIIAHNGEVWKIERYIIPNIIELVLNDTSLKERLRVGLEMFDYDNWSNGEYRGDRNRIDDMIDFIIGEIDL
jgi:hypothetical protein